MANRGLRTSPIRLVSAFPCGRGVNVCNAAHAGVRGPYVRARACALTGETLRAATVSMHSRGSEPTFSVST